MITSQGTQPAVDRPRVEVLIGLGLVDDVGDALNSDRTLQGRPPKGEGSVGVDLELVGLATGVVCVPDETFVIKGLEQDHAGTGAVEMIDCGETHGVGLVLVDLSGVAHPLGEEGVRGVGEGVFMERLVGVIDAKVGDGGLGRGSTGGRLVGHGCEMAGASAGLEAKREMGVNGRAREKG